MSADREIRDEIDELKHNTASSVGTGNTESFEELLKFQSIAWEQIDQLQTDVSKLMAVNMVFVAHVL